MSGIIRNRRTWKECRRKQKTEIKFWGEGEDELGTIMLTGLVRELRGFRNLVGMTGTGAPGL